MAKFSSTDSGATILSKLNNTIVTVGFDTGCDYVCDGTADEVHIQAAIDYVDSLGGGKVELRAGTYDIAASIICNSLNHYDNIWIDGEGIGATTLKYSAGAVLIYFGSNDNDSGIITKNLRFSNFTLDMNNQVASARGLYLPRCQDVFIDNVHFKNQATGAKHFLGFGVSVGTSAMVGRNLLVSNCIFSDSTCTNWEAITLAQAFNCKFVNCIFRDKPTISSMLLQYGSYDVSIIGCDFKNCSNTINGHGNTLISGCNFYESRLRVLAENTTIIGCSFRGSDSVIGGRLSFSGWETLAGELPWDDAEAGTRISVKNNKVIGCTFEDCNTYGIEATYFTGSDDVKYLSCEDLTITGCSFTSSLWIGINVLAKYLILKDNIFRNNGTVGTSSNAYNFSIGAKKAIVSGNRSYDDQTPAVVLRDFFIENYYASTIADLATQDITFSDNQFEVGSIPYFHVVGGFQSTVPDNVTIHWRNNLGFVTENSGTGTIANGATSATITHGLSVTPTLDDISITLGENPTNTPGAIWVDNLGATTFVVNCENDPGASGLDFAWKAICL